MTVLTGVWTYRSFVNNPLPVDTPDDALKLIFGEGELTVESASPEAGFHAALSFGGDAVMDLVGNVIPGDYSRPLVVTARGRGRPNSPVADFIYDYIFYAVPAWADAVNQRAALVGTVIRAADHGTAKKGVTASTITVRRDG
jgi:hypothetical protein